MEKNNEMNGEATYGEMWENIIGYLIEKIRTGYSRLRMIIRGNQLGQKGVDFNVNLARFHVWCITFNNFTIFIYQELCEAIKEGVNHSFQQEV